jgi:hypothetical protein
MNYIETEMIIIKPFEKLNHFLICILCAGVVIDPKQCTKCKKLVCSMCLLNKTTPQCECGEINFIQPQEKVLQELKSLLIKSPCCSRQLNYDNYLTHLTNCPSMTQCQRCNIYHLKDQEHRNCKEALVTENILSKDQTAINPPTTTREVFIHTTVTDLQKSCYICKQRARYACLKCRGDICQKCGTSCWIFGLNGFERRVRLKVVSYRKCMDWDYFCPVFLKLNPEIVGSRGPRLTGNFYYFYFTGGWVIYLFILLMTTMVYIILIPFVFVACVCLCIFFYMIFVVPCLFIYWLFYLKGKRKCLKCRV